MKPTKLIELYNKKIVIEFYEDKHWYIRTDIGRIITSVSGVTGLVGSPDILMAWAIKLTRNHLIDIIESGNLIRTDDIYTACGLYREKRDTAGNIGTAVHNWIDCYIKSKISKGKEIKLPTDEKILNGVIAFKTWESENKVKFIQSEKIVYMAWYESKFFCETGERDYITLPQYLKLTKKQQKDFDLAIDYVGTLDLKAIVNGKMTLVDHKTGNYLSDTVPFQVSAYLEADRMETGTDYEERMILHIKKDTGDFKVVNLGMENHDKDFQAFKGLLIAKNRLKEKGGGKK